MSKWVKSSLVFLVLIFNLLTPVTASAAESCNSLGITANPSQPNFSDITPNKTMNLSFASPQANLTIHNQGPVELREYNGINSHAESTPVTISDNSAATGTFVLNSPENQDTFNQLTGAGLLYHTLNLYFVGSSNEVCSDDFHYTVTVPSCANYGITGPATTFFPEGTQNPELTFQVTGQALSDIGNRNVEIREGTSNWASSQPTTVQNGELQIPLTNSLNGNLASTDHTHNVTLHLAGINSADQICSDKISYNVGSSGNSCSFPPDVVSSLATISPTSPLDIKFVGKPSTPYSLSLITLHGPGNFFEGVPSTIGSSVTTDGSGNGEFKVSSSNLGSGGDHIEFRVSNADKTNQCSINTALSNGAGNQGSIANQSASTSLQNSNTGAIQPAVNPCSQSGTSCTTSGYSPCNNALGLCIDTNNPTSFIQGLMTFAIGIAGGIALLLMGFGAIGMITSQGNAEALKAAQGRFTSAVIGLLFIIFSVFLLHFIGVNILGIPGFS